MISNGIIQGPGENFFVVSLEMMKLRMALTMGDKDASAKTKQFMENNEYVPRYSTDAFTDGLFVELGHKMSEMLVR